MACGDRYAHLLVTATGLSPANPYDRLATSADFNEWEERARELSIVVRSFFDALRPVETDTAQWNALVERQNAMVAAYEALPTVLWDTGASIAQAIDVCRQAACLLELIEDRLATYGAKPPPTPGAPEPTEKPSDFVFGTAAQIVATVIGGYILWRIVRR